MSRVRVALALLTLALLACGPGYRSELAATSAAQPDAIAVIIQVAMPIHTGRADLLVPTDGRPNRQSMAR